MCVVTAKYFDSIGWVGVKNRDRNYVPDISFKRIKSGDNEIMLFWDDITKYCEGFNSSGICIISASLMVLDDEKEITTRTKTPSKDGVKLRRALKQSNIKDVARKLIRDKLPGNTLIFDNETCYLLEGSWKDGGYAKREYQYKIREIPQDQTVARTNHGIWVKDAGYQRNPNNDSENKSRISSESRLLIAKTAVDLAEKPMDIIDNLAKTWVDNPQLNALRTSGRGKQMRTTSQIMMIPSERTMYIRPVQSHMAFDFWDLNNPKHDLWIELLSNRILYKHQKALSERLSKSKMNMLDD